MQGSRLRTLAALAVCGVGGFGCGGALWGCESGSALRNVQVDYRFENVRQTKSLDEWAQIRKILNARAAKPVASEIVGSTSEGGITISAYRVTAVLPSLRDVDLVQADLEELAAARVEGSRIQFSLASLGATYRSNVVSATVIITISGIASAGNTIRLYQNPGMPVVETKADTWGVWSSKLSIVPQTKWVYGISVDRSPNIPPRYFRIDVSTQKQEDLNEAEFKQMAPKPAPPGSSPAQSSVTPKDPDSDELRKRWEAEDQAIKRKRAAEDAKWSKPN